MVGQIEPAFLDGDIGKLLLAPRSFELLIFGEDFGLMAAVIVVGEFKKDQPEHWRGILAGLKVGVGTQVIGGTPEIGFELFELFFGHGDSINRKLRGSRLGLATHGHHFTDQYC